MTNDNDDDDDDDDGDDDDDDDDDTRRHLSRNSGRRPVTMTRRKCDA